MGNFPIPGKCLLKQLPHLTIIINIFSFEILCFLSQQISGKIIFEYITKTDSFNSWIFLVLFNFEILFLILIILYESETWLVFAGIHQQVPAKQMKYILAK